ncbi:GRASP55/65 PDZ-like domain [Trypanosoma melophagium]|uniref:GRASP55/65 PDZ-like domain n=1 Tax=Trypanosoma melophagium TaxID=715481 RepID=UPI00351A2F44|nr:GRASP55/65 PDZ-like domain [Trypanosoma melophagium]
MGQDQSKGEDPLENIQGLQISRVLPRSPAHAAGLVPFFDIITAVDQIEILDPSTASEQFRLYISDRENQPLCLRVYNLRLRAYREVRCVPSRAWGGGGMLGCSIEWAAAAGCVERSWHVVEVLAGGPAARGGLAAGRDHVIGMQRAEEPLVTLLRDEEDLHSRLGLWRGLQRAALQRRQRLQAYTAPSSVASSSAAAASLGQAGREGRGGGDVWLGRLVMLVYDAVANEVREAVLEFGEEVDAPLGMNLAAGLLHSLVTTGDTPSLIAEAETDGKQEEKNHNSDGNDDNNSISSSSTSTSKVRNRSGASRGLPVMTTFLTPSGSLERLERYTREMPVPLVEEEETHTAREDIAQPALLPSIPAPYTTLMPPVQRSLPTPPLPELQTKEVQPQHLANVTESGSSIYTKVSNGIQGIRIPPPIPFTDRSTIPIISRSRPTTTAGFVEIHPQQQKQQQQQQQQNQSKGQEYQQQQQQEQPQPEPSSLQQQHQHLNPFRETNVVVTNGPLPTLCRQEQPQPQKQQQEQNLSAEVNVDKKGENSSLAHNISGDINSGFKPTAQQPTMDFPKLPPPLHFPIIRPQSPTQ